MPRQYMVRCSTVVTVLALRSYEMLPVNQPKCPFHLNAEAGAMNFSHDNGEVCRALQL